MKNDSGALSIDLIVGFTIFMVAFIWVITLVPGLLINLQGYTIDYDAVAYRTGVILVEDPGEINDPVKTVPWEGQSLPSKVARFGLATSRETPNILSQDKIDRFFDKAIFTTEEYRKKAIFGDYPYKFNISLYDVEQNKKLFKATGPLPEGYGYSRRLAKIKSTSGATIDMTLIEREENSDNFYVNNFTLIYAANTTEGLNATTHVFSMLIDTPMLFRQETDPVYRIDPLKEPVRINISDLGDPRIRSNQTATINLTKIQENGDARTDVNISVDGNYARWPVQVANYINITIPQEVFQSINYGISNPGDYVPVWINLTFDVTNDGNSTFLNNTWSSRYSSFKPSPFLYDHNPDNVTQPQLRDALVEVAVW